MLKSGSRTAAALAGAAGVALLSTSTAYAFWTTAASGVAAASTGDIGAPTLTVSATSTTSALMTFSAGSGVTPTGYVATSTPGALSCATTASSPTSCAITGLSEGTVYSFTAVALRGGWVSSPSSPVGLTTGFSLSMSTASLPSGTVGVAYSATLQATGGQAPYSWSLTGTLPAGLALNATTGTISGTPTAAIPTPAALHVTVTDAAAGSTSRDLTLAVSSAPVTGPTITTTSLPAGQVGAAYPATTLASTGGLAPKTWSLSAGSLPAGLSLSSAGALSGTPTTAATSTFTVKVVDANAAEATKQLSIVVAAAPTVSFTLPAQGVIYGPNSSGARQNWNITSITGTVTGGTSVVVVMRNTTTGLYATTITGSGRFTSATPVPLTATVTGTSWSLAWDKDQFPTVDAAMQITVTPSTAAGSGTPVVRTFTWKA